MSATQRRRWADALIAAGGPDVPEYGSPEWQRLDDRDSRKVAACVIAAEAQHCCWELGIEDPS